MIVPNVAAKISYHGYFNISRLTKHKFSTYGAHQSIWQYKTSSEWLKFSHSSEYVVTRIQSVVSTQ